MNNTYFCSLEQFGSLSLSGPDAQKFLQGQVTCDVTKVSVESGQAGAYCTPKGNVIANFDVIAHGDTILMHMPKTMVATVHQAMGKYIVFSKAVLADASENWCCLSVWGSAAQEAIKQTFGSIPAAKQKDMIHCVQSAYGVSWCNNSESDEFIVYCDPSLKTKLIETLAQHATEVESNQWELLQIAKGQMYITPSITDSFVPQMLNLQETGAINFKKGCYTGQEIVARMQYLGKLKRHLMIGELSSTQEVVIGQQIDSVKRKNVGRITSVATIKANTYHFTAVITRQEAEEELHIHQDLDSKISLSQLPYTIDPQVFERIKL